MRSLVLAASCVAVVGTVAGSRSFPDRMQVSPDTLDLVVAGTTDMHGWLRGWDYFAAAPDTTRGLSRIATIVDSLRAASPGRVILVDAGDNLQGAPITNLALRDSQSPNPIASAMNAAGYDAAVVGNHEFNFGLPYLMRVAR